MIKPKKIEAGKYQVGKYLVYKTDNGEGLTLWNLEVDNETCSSTNTLKEAIYLVNLEMERNRNR